MMIDFVNPSDILVYQRWYFRKYVLDLINCDLRKILLTTKLI